MSGFAVTGTTVGITDDDASPTVTLLLSDSSIDEDGGSTTVTASLSHASSVGTTVTVGVSPDSPAVTGDYAVSANKVLTIAAGQTASTGAVTVTGVANDVDTADKTVRVQGTAGNTVGTSGPADATLTLEDDDTRGVTLSKSDLDIDEGGSGTYTVVLDSEPTASVTVRPSRSSGDADVTVSGALTFTTANWDTARTVTVSTAQDLDAVDDTAVIGHSVSGADYGGVTAASVDVTVDDDETASSGVTLSVSPERVSEGASGTPVTVTARLNGGTRGEATPVSVTVGSGTATSGTDFAAVAGFTITIAANTLSNTGTFTLTPTQDTVDEPDETVKVDGTTTVSGFAVTGTTVEITDADASPTVTLSLSDTSITEDGGVTTVTASLSHASSVGTTVTVSVSPDSPAVAGDYTLSANTTLTITAGQTASTGAVTVAGVNNDVDTVDKTVRVKGLTANNLGVTGPSDVALSILDDDGIKAANSNVSSRGANLSVSPSRVGEGAGAITVTVRVALDGLPLSVATPVSVTVGSGTATSGTDFAAVAGFTITIAAKTLSNTGTFTLTPTQDTVDEPDETVAVDGTTTVSGFAVMGTTVEITDDDASPTVTLSLSDASITEDGGVTTVTASLSHASSVGTTVTVSVSPDSPAVAGDYAVRANKVLTIAAGQTASTGAMTVTGVDNDVDTVDKTVRVKGAASNAVGTSGPSDVTLTLEDDDTRGVTVSKTNLEIDEGDDGTYTVVLTSEPTGQVVVTPSRSSGDADVTVSGALTFTADDWATPRTVTVSTAQDLDAVDDTAVIGHAVSGGDYGGVTADSVDVTVDDDETASNGVALSVSPETVGEGAAATMVTVTARLNGGTRGEATPVSVTVGSGTATSGTDFAEVAGFTITIPANTRSHTDTFTLTPTQDTLDEPDETVSVDGATPVPGFSVRGTSIEITDDDDEPPLDPPRNTAPTGRDRVATVDEDGVYIFAASDFGFSDSDPGDRLAGVRIVTAPAAGVLEVHGAAVGAGDVVDVSDIDDGGLGFMPAPDANGSPYARITFRVNDGTEDSAEANAMTMNVAPVNDPATGRPGIFGSPGQGEVLSTDTSAIADVDGMSHAEFHHQWIRVVSAEDRDIPDATDATYTLEAADMGAELRVRVGFTDDGGFDEVLVSEAVETPRIAVPLEPRNFRATGGRC